MGRLQITEGEFIDRLKSYIKIELGKHPFGDQCYLAFLLDVANFAYEKEEDRINRITKEDREKTMQRWDD